MKVSVLQFINFHYGVTCIWVIVSLLIYFTKESETLGKEEFGSLTHCMEMKIRGGPGRLSALNSLF